MTALGAGNHDYASLQQLRAPRSRLLACSKPVLTIVRGSRLDGRHTGIPSGYRYFNVSTATSWAFAFQRIAFFEGLMTIDSFYFQQIIHIIADIHCISPRGTRVGYTVGSCQHMLLAHQRTSAQRPAGNC